MSSQMHCLACGRVMLSRAGTLRECAFCGSRMLEPVATISAVGPASAAEGALRPKSLFEKSFVSAVCCFVALSILIHDQAAPPLVALFGLAFVVFATMSAVCALRQVYLAWLALERCVRAGTRGSRLISPVQAVGLLFVPFFNLYWVFRVFPGWATLASELMEARKSHGQRPCQAVHQSLAATWVASFVLSFVAAASGHTQTLALVTCLGQLMQAVLLFLAIRDMQHVSRDLLASGQPGEETLWLSEPARL